MNKTVSAIPAQCNKCGAVFDISYDLEGMDRERLMFELLFATPSPRNFLCWKCRQR